VPTNEKPSRKSATHSGRKFFVLATACSFPFIALLACGLIGMISGRKMFVNVFLGSVFLAPGFLLLSLSTALFAVLAWRKVFLAQRVLLVVYALMITAYWTVVRTSGPW